MSRYATALILLSLLTGCTFGPGWARRLSGTVVDAETGVPVPSATVFSTYFTQSSMLNRGHAVDTSWSEADPLGRFSIPGHVALNLRPRAGLTQTPPQLLIYHPDYGLFQEPIGQRYNREQHARWRAQRWENLQLRLKKGRWFPPEKMSDVHYILGACKRFQLIDGGCDHLCSLTVGVIACRDVAADSS